MARKLNVGAGARIVIRGDTSMPMDCTMEYRVINADGVSADLLEEPAMHREKEFNFNQKVKALCIVVGTTVENAEAVTLKAVKNV